MNFTGVLIPNTLKSLTIHNCSSVILDNPELNRIHLKQLFIRHIGELSIGAQTLRRVKELEFEHIDHLFTAPEAFDQLETDTIRFETVAFTPTSKRFSPFSVRQRMIFARTEFSPEMLISANQSVIDDTQVDNSELVVRFDGCRMDRIKLELGRVAEFEMVNSIFYHLSEPKSLTVLYSVSISMINNVYNNTKLPDIRCYPKRSASRDSSLMTDVNFDDGRRWWKSFEFTNLDALAVSRMPGGSQKLMDCGEWDKLEEFFSEPSPHQPSFSNKVNSRQERIVGEEPRSGSMRLPIYIVPLIVSQYLLMKLFVYSIQ